MSAVTTGPYRVGVVGAGWAARSIWLPRLLRHPAFEVAAVVDAAPAARAAVRDHAPGARLLASTEQLGADVDLAVVAVPNHLHNAVAVDLLRRGVPVFVEKPVCLNSAEAVELAHAERSAGAVLLAGSAARYRSDVGALREVAAGLGSIRHIDLSWVRAGGIPDGAGWFTRRQLSGGGALLDLGWHLLDLVEPLLGPVDVTQAVGMVTDDFINRAASRADWRGDGTGEMSRGDVEDTARGFLVTGDGVSIALQASWASHEERDVTTVRIDGSAGSALLRCTFGFSPNRVEVSSLSVHRDGRVEPVPVTEEAIGAEYDRQLDDIAVRLTDPAAKGRGVAEAARAIDVIERLYASARHFGASAASPQVTSR
ncbi:Gfo/Idh/MocA family protein [Micromonospora sp. DT31]|uniref:Gfo/Idh/MocA family protein n=1 Tax=Micromonospora sp. DT31 TaxID=3393434 RepID=UPI003CF59ACD